MVPFFRSGSSSGQERKSIDGKLKSLIRQMIIPFTVILVLVVGLFLVFMLQDARMSSNITTASRFNHNFKDEVDLKMYTFVSGSSEELPFAEVETARSLAETLLRTTGNREAHRTIQSVLNLCDNLYDSIVQIRDAVGYDERMQQLESNIYVITELIEEYMYSYLYIEAGELAEAQQQFNTVVILESLAAGILMLLLIRRTAARTRKISSSITAPIDALYDRVDEIGHGDLQSKPPVHAEDEKLQSLSDGIEQMVQKLDTQMLLNNEEQKRVRSMELALIQAQINPHFLYNTLDAIVWLIETGKTEEAEKMIISLSTYFRSFLSNGKEIITLAEEERHIRSYLEIQQVRYKDILSYQIDFDPEYSQCLIPKMTLQPLVENALYHGIKNKRGSGLIRITGRIEDELIRFEVSDDGVGMDEEALGHIRKELTKPAKDTDTGFGMANVNERIKMNFGDRYGISIESELGKGTTVSVVIPAILFNYEEDKNADKQK